MSDELNFNDSDEELNPNFAPASADDSQDIELPSGLSGRIRRWKPRDLRFLSDRRTLRKPGPIVNATILKTTWIETHEVGPYAFTGHPPWMGEVLAGDTTAAVFYGRRLSFGDEYPVEFLCESPGCGERIPYDADLSHLEVVRLPDELLANGDGFTWTFPECGREVIYVMATGRTQVLGGKLARQHGLIDEVAWASRIKKIEGVTSPGQFVEFLGDLSPVDSQALNAELVKHEVGIKTEVMVTCESPGCELEQKRELGFASNFYKPQDGERDLLR